MTPLTRLEKKLLRTAAEMQQIATPEMRVKLPLLARKFFQGRPMTMAAAKVLMNDYMRHHPHCRGTDAADPNRRIARTGFPRIV